jgi:hypothetical protein
MHATEELIKNVHHLPLKNNFSASRLDVYCGTDRRTEVRLSIRITLRFDK